MFTYILAAIVAFLLGACIIAVVLGRQSTALRSQLAALEAELNATRNSLDSTQEQLNKSSGELKMNIDARHAAELEAGRLAEQLKQQELQFAQQLKQQEQQWNEKIELLTGARVELSNQFKTLANDILEEKTKRFTEQNQTNFRSC